MSALLISEIKNKVPSDIHDIIFRYHDYTKAEAIIRLRKFLQANRLALRQVASRVRVNYYLKFQS